MYSGQIEDGACRLRAIFIERTFQLELQV